jgi:hypothetical protein
MHKVKREVMIVKKVTLTLGKETFGDKNLEVAFQEAFAPYFVKEEKGNELGLLNRLQMSPMKNGGKWSSAANQ